MSGLTPFFNMNQVRTVLEDVDEQFKNFDHTKEPGELETRYLEEKYPLLFEQGRRYDFGTPTINFLESKMLKEEQVSCCLTN